MDKDIGIGKTEPKRGAIIRTKTLSLFILAVMLFACGKTAHQAGPVSRGCTIPTVDLAGQTERQVVVDREPGQYLGHPTTVLLEDARTMIVVYAQGHGRGPLIMKRSPDGGLTWSRRLPVPENWATSLETPTIHGVVGPDGTFALTTYGHWTAAEQPYIMSVRFKLEDLDRLKNK